MTIHFQNQDTVDATQHPTLVVAYDDKLSKKPVLRNSYRRVFKRSLDFLITLLAIPLILPLIALPALLIALDGHNPFYSQLRIGKGGRSFRMWKLRTMVPDADGLLDSYLDSNPEAKQEWDRTQKLKTDPRITKAGRILRKTSLDELPQLFNVLIGDMSLVGPRPMMTSQRDDYYGQAYYKLRPGITGLWQISDRNECDFVGRVGYDDTYERGVTFRADLSILWRTVGVILRGTGY